MQFCALDTGATHLVLSHLSGLLVDDPGDRLRERRRGQGARIRPVVPAGGQQAGGLEGAQGRPRVLGEETAGSQVGGGGRGRGHHAWLYLGDVAWRRACLRDKGCGRGCHIWKP